MATDTTLELWRDYLERRCGMSFSETRLRVLSQTLEARRKAGAFASLTDYYHAIIGQPNGREWVALFQQLLNNETRFFRDAAAFTALRNVVLPELRRSRWSGTRGHLSFWSAGCSAGQEAYSLAMACREADLQRGWDVRILGTDIHPENLARATRGRYRSFEVKSLSQVQLHENFTGTDSDGYQISDEVKSLVRFEWLDLATAHDAIPPQDVIFCQNVLIYYSAEAKAKIIRNLTQTLTPGGYLFLGAAEAVGIPTPGLELVQLEEAWIFRRMNPVPPRSESVVRIT
jgi:chemotaxis methyl-accepting protein methylase